MPLVEVSLIEGRPPADLERLIQELSEAVETVLDVPAESVRVIVHEVPARLWGVGGKAKKKPG